MVCVLVVSLMALVPRVVTLVLTIDSPGDGPSRATLAYQWSRSPHLVKADSWPPGFMYLGGTLAFAIDDPVASRILNVALGTLTVPLLFALVARVYEPVTALVSATLLAVFPLHVGLSASSLAEPSFVFEMVAGAYLLVRAASAPEPRPFVLGLALVCFSFAEMTRYEGWLLVLPVPVYLYLRTRRTATTVLAITVLLAFPVAWTLGNYLNAGDPSLGFRAAQVNDKRVGSQAVDLLTAMSIIGVAGVAHFGWALPVAMVCGSISQLLDASRARLDTERLLYLVMVGIFWLMMIRFAAVRGTSLFNRYLLFGFVVSLPLAVLPFAGAGTRRPVTRALMLLTRPSQA